MPRTNSELRGGEVEAYTFLRALWPDNQDGYIVVCVTDGHNDDTFRKHGAFPATAVDGGLNGFWKTAEAGVERSSSGEVYVSVCLQRTAPAAGRGEAKNARWMPGLWLDIDLFLDLKPQKTRRPQTLDECDLWISELGLEPSLIVCSGGGLHVYWLFDEPVDLDESAEVRALAEAANRGIRQVMNELGAKYGWELDSGGQDLAKVLRLPGTLNYKKAPLRAVTLQNLEAGKPPAVMRQSAEGLFERFADVGARPKTNTRGVDFSETGGHDPAVINPDANMGQILAGCAFMRHARDHAAGLSYDEWRALLSTSERCVNGIDIAHEFSRPHTDYTADETNKKLLSLAEVPPIRCTTISEYWGTESECARCPSWGKIVNPVELGRKPEDWQMAASKRLSDMTGASASDDGGDEDVLEREGSYPLPQSIAGVQLGLTDEENALRFVHRYGRDVRWTAAKDFLVWNGLRWLADDTEAVLHLASETAFAIRDEEAVAAPASTADAVHGWGQTTLRKGVDKMAKAARRNRRIARRMTDFDRDPWLYNCANGTYDFRTGRLLLHTRKHLITKLCGVEYDPEARDQRLDGYLLEATGGDREVIQYLQMAAGYGLVGVTSEEAFFLIVGPPGSGKSTFIDMISGCAGDSYHGHVQMNIFGRGQRSNPEYVMSSLYGKRLVTSVETEKMRYDEELLRQVTGGDLIEARDPYGKPFWYRPSWTLFVASNEVPSADGDPGVWRRQKVIYFNEVPKTRDDSLKPYLRDSVAGRMAVLAWMIEGARLWKEAGRLEPPRAVLEAIQSEQEDDDAFGRFLRERCIPCPLEQGDCTEKLHRAYQLWASDDDEKKVSGTIFGKRLRRRGIEKGRARGCTRAALTLRPEAAAEVELLEIGQRMSVQQYE